jgi:hypothetical protein
MAEARRIHQTTAVFRNVNDAVRAYQWLQAIGFQEGHISVLISDKSRDAFEGAINNPHAQSDRISAPQAERSGATGVAVGAGLFALAGAAISGLGLVVAGPLVAALAGGGVGAMVGGLVGGLVGYGFPEESARAYERALREGAVALGVLPRSEEEAKQVREEFERLHGEQIITT